LTGALLYRARLAEPFGGLELIFSVSRLPTPAGAAVIGWMATTLALVLLVGGWLLYRLGVRQLDLIRQQQDFVSAVSHELKTPLTSIRMYAEMLRAGFASEERKSTYYRFIHEESERLSRLIANVLQLARIGRDALVLEPRVMPIGELMALVVERVASQVERAGFRLELSGEDSAAELLVDPDAFVQILINLVDNALKFAAGAETRTIRLGVETLGNGRLRVSVRDFGPGIPRDQRRRVFQLFQRGEMAKRQAIPGTGIGLALVERLMRAMGGRVEVTAAEPGAEFRLEFPLNR
jgi:two-component system, OmpR family, phosphate regulon sensor histidine kinase PhoR